MEGVVKLKSVLVSGCPSRDVGSQQNDETKIATPVEGVLRRKSFYFQQRTGKLDIRAIGRVDVDRVVHEVDIDTLQAHLENIVFSDVTEDDLRLYSDACFLNLFRLSQLLLEYLLSVQDTLATSLEELAAKHSTLRQMVDAGRAELSQASRQVRALRREVRQKRATISRYEQLLALPPPSRGGKAPGIGGNGGKLHSCLICGKLFVTGEFLQQHIARKHTRKDEGEGTDEREAAENKPSADGESGSQSFPGQLRLFIQTSSGQCLDMAVQSGATVSQLRKYINSAAGFAAAGSNTRVVYRGVQLHEDQTLGECRLPTDSQLMLVDAEVSDATPAQAKARAEEQVACPQGAKEEESAASKQMSTLVALMRQQMEWTMQSAEERQKQGMTAAEALDIRMRELEASLPRRLEELMEDSVSDLRSSVREAARDMQTLQGKQSNAGALVDDEEDTRKKEDEENERLASLSEEIQRVSRENAALAEELNKVKSSKPTNEATQEDEAPEEPEAATETIPNQEDIPAPEPIVSDGKIGDTSRRSSVRDLVFPSDGERPAVTVRVSQSDTCETVCESVAAALDTMEARVVLRDTQKGDILDPQTPATKILALHEERCLGLEVLEGTIISNNVVDGLVEFYERNVPVAARDSQRVAQSMAEIELAAKRRVASRKTRGRAGSGIGTNTDGEQDAAEHAANQVEAIRAELASTLTGGRVIGADLGKSISRTVDDGLRLGLRASAAEGGTSSEDIFGLDSADGVREDRPGLEELRLAVERRQRTRPEGITLQMANVSHSVENQLGKLLVEAEEELDLLEQDSLGSVTFSSKDEEGSDEEVGDDEMDNGEGGRRGRSHEHGDSRASRFNEAIVLDKKGDWNKTLDTTVSIPDGPEARADEHEANAASSLE